MRHSRWFCRSTPLRAGPPPRHAKRASGTPGPAGKEESFESILRHDFLHPTEPKTGSHPTAPNPRASGTPNSQPSIRCAHLALSSSSRVLTLVSWNEAREE
jgi:hypothetical protein